MKLQEFMKKKGLSYREMSKVCGVSYSCLHHYVMGGRTPSVDLAYRIEVATKKKVKMEDMISLDVKSKIDCEFSKA